MINRLKVIPPLLAVDFLIQICEALDYAHERKIIHRDINPTNIIVQQNDRLKILDFGLACPVGTEDFSNAGTAHYMAPEQIQGDPLDPRTDIYALGITAYEMITGEKPFSESEISDILTMQKKKEIPDPIGIVPNIPDQLRRFIVRATHLDPNQRHQSIKEVIKDLNSLVKDQAENQDVLPITSRKMTILMLSFSEEHQYTLNRLVDDFSSKVQKLGVDLKVSDFRDA
jgi:serine/threonine protein kinase